MKVKWLLPALVLLAAASARPALTEKRPQVSDEKVTQALRTALSTAKAEGMPFDAEHQTLTIRRARNSWNFRFDRLPLADGRRLPDSTLTIRVQDDGQTNVSPAL